MANMKMFKGYLVSDEGIVYTAQGKPKATTVQKNTGYSVVTLYYEGHPHVHGIHRIVAELFLPKTGDGYMFVEHVDGNRLNNNVSNLRWTERPSRQSTLKTSTRVMVTEINGVKNTYMSLTKAAKAYGVTTAAASGYVQGKYNDRTGRKWESY